MEARLRCMCHTILAVLVFWTGTGACQAQGSSASEYQVKAAFLFNFARFVEWPASSFADPQAPFAVCVLGQDPFGRMLDDALQRKTIGERPVVLRRLRNKSEARNCQIVFVSSSESRSYADIFGSLRGASTLVVGETRDFAASGGMIEFLLEDNRVRFAVNTDPADRAGLKFSSKLLALARIVHDGGGTDGR